MQFNTREDIALPSETVFAALSDFGAFERSAARHGAEVLQSGGTATGQGWRVRFPFRGKPRVLEAEILRHEPPRALVSLGRVGGLEGTLALELVSLAPGRTRLLAGLQVVPTTLRARVVLQSARLAKPALNRRFKAGFGRLIREIEARNRP